MIVVGAGINGLAAGIVLAKAGWTVVILEREPEPGGAVRSAEVTLPGYTHDLFATNLSGFVASAFFAEFGDELLRHGLQFLRASKPFCSVFPDGDGVGVTTDPAQTASMLQRLSMHDAQSWRALTQSFRRAGPYLSRLMRQPMPSWQAIRTLAEGTRAHGIKLPAELLSLLTASHASFVDRHFDNPKIAAMWAAWGMHLDFAPGVRGGALFGLVQCLSAQASGLSFAKGGASAVPRALQALLHAAGGEVRCHTPVDEVLIRDGNAIGVRTAAGEVITARRAVIANVTPTVLFGKLVKRGVAQSVVRKARRYRYGPGTMMIHLALSALPNWRYAMATEFAYVHVAPSIRSMSRTYDQAVRGQLPEEPVLVVAQPTAFDSSRAPGGHHVVSIQVRVVPSGLPWDAMKEKYADQLLGLLERYAPGIGQQVIGRCVLSPLDLERANPNLVGGDNLSGSHHLDQHFIFRPFLGWSRYRTPVKRLHICGASTWPGAGVGAGSGYLLGRLLLQAADQPPSTRMSAPVT